jgi:L-amino acid N-acyltransferase YncA
MLNFIEKPVLTGDLVTLRPVQPADAAALLAIDDETARLTGSLGRGLGTEATRLITDYAFTVVGLHRITLEVYAFNPRARHVYDKVGFVHEGTMRDALRWNGTWVDCHLMAMLPTDRKPPA